MAGPPPSKPPWFNWNLCMQHALYRRHLVLCPDNHNLTCKLSPFFSSNLLLGGLWTFPRWVLGTFLKWLFPFFPSLYIFVLVNCSLVVRLVLCQYLFIFKHIFHLILSAVSGVKLNACGVNICTCLTILVRAKWSHLYSEISWQVTCEEILLVLTS